jgi:LuxR family maltose regulon positive regulatory protein
MLAELLADSAANDRLHLYPAAGARLHLGEIFYEWNRLEEAAGHLEAAVSLSQTPEMAFETYSYALLARCYAALGRRAEAAEAIGKAEQSVLQAVHAPRRILTLAQICAFWLGQGDANRAAAWLPDGRDILLDPRNEVFARQEMARANYLLAVGDGAGAAEIVRALLPAAETAGRLRDVVELLLLRARLEEEEAETAVRRALSLAEPGGLVRTFLDGGAAVAALLTRLKGRPDVPGAYLVRLLAAFAPAVESTANRLLVEPLSERELEVLRLMAEGFSNREIAERLYFTVGTAKKHAEHIYGKLGVNNRTQAIVRARELGVIG